MIATESWTTSPSSSITGTGSWPLIASTGARFEYSIITDCASIPLWARLAGEGEAHPLAVCRPLGPVQLNRRSPSHRRLAKRR